MAVRLMPMHVRPQAEGGARRGHDDDAWATLNDVIPQLSYIFFQRQATAGDDVKVPAAPQAQRYTGPGSARLATVDFHNIDGRLGE
eukprot:9240213-Pyramimonas_sp.AAC.1